jgi:CDP-glycerol glycerophosphotransferase (TagB/SpsB family)
MIYVKRANYTINGDFIEKYFTMFLKLKAVVGSRQLNFFSNVFYSTDYITYIIIGHSVLYFKYFSDEKDIYEKRKFDKLILPPSERVINLAKSFGWTDDDILQINFPRWDKYNNLNETKKGYININVTEKVILDSVNISGSYLNNISNSLSIINETNHVEIINKTITIREERTIFMFFSWRNFAKDNEISNYYFENITKILVDEKLNEILERENIKIYFSIHGLVINKYRSTYRSLLYYNKHIDWIEPQDISNCISESELIITDFSTLIFDFVYMRKPFICYIPDIDDPDVTFLYKPEYFEFYKNIKSGHFNFENVVFSVNELVEKINYYINNDFTLDENIKTFYDSFGIRKENNIEQLINYLINL